MEETALQRSIISAAERGDRIAFVAAAHRLGGDFADAQKLARDKAALRMVDRVASVVLDEAERSPALQPVEFRDARADAAADGEDDGSTLFGHFTAFNVWYEVDSFFEGHFMERVAPGATKKTIRENRDNMKVTFQHGRDPVAGDKPLGPIEQLSENDYGSYFEIRLLRDDTGEFPGYIADIVPGLREGVYGSSHTFRVMREEFDYEVDTSDHNPNGLPERTLREIQVMEFGPVTFPANPAATASVRSRQEAEDAPSDRAGAAVAAEQSNGTPVEERRAPMFRDREEFTAWLSTVES